MNRLSTRIASPAARLLFVAGAVIAATLVLAAQSAQPAKPKTAAEEFKNIQILKDIPADQLIPSMQFIAASLNVECGFCHVEHAFDKDDKEEKRTARQMMTMMMAINKDNFKGQREVTCNTCHQGATHPPAGPAIKEVASVIEATPAHDHDQPAQPTITADEIIAKYVQAIGGKDAAAKVTSRIQKGNVLMGATPVPVEIYSKAPDKRVSIVHMPTGDSFTAANGANGWLYVVGPRPPRDMNAGESAAALLDAQILLGVSPKEIFSNFRVGRPEKIGDKEVNVLMARREGQPPVRLYFDKQSGLLVRMLRSQETPLGRNPTQVDYADYRDSGGVKTPFRWTIARPSNRFTIQVDSVQQNVPIDDKKFEKPAAAASPAAPNQGPAAH